MSHLTYLNLSKEIAEWSDIRRRRGKRIFDLVLSAAGILFLTPLAVLIAVFIRLNDGGPIFYRQDRVGKAGKPFRIWKFRSMSGQCVTATGRFLRATGMDELPQLWNIIKGDMSFVGPRPLLPEEAEVDFPHQSVPLTSIPAYHARHRVRPGLTGVAQIFAPRQLPRRKKFRLDLLYIRKQSFSLDLRLIAASVLFALDGKCDQPWERPKASPLRVSKLNPV